MNMAMVPGESAIKKPAGRRADRVENGTSRESSSPSMQACRHGIAIPPPEPSLRMTRARRHARRSGGRGRKGRAIGHCPLNSRKPRSASSLFLEPVDCLNIRSGLSWLYIADPDHYRRAKKCSDAKIEVGRVSLWGRLGQ